MSHVFQLLLKIKIKIKKGLIFVHCARLNILGISHSCDLLGLFPIHAIQVSQFISNNQYHYAIIRASLRIHIKILTGTHVLLI